MHSGLFKLTSFLIKFALLCLFFYIVIWVWIIRLLLTAE